MTEEQKHPQCFDSLEQWEVYKDLWQKSQGGKVNFCLDCQPAYRDQMTAQGRCAHPETVFVKAGERRSKAIEMRSKGMTLKEIGQSLGVTAQAVCIMLKNNQGKQSSMTEEGDLIGINGSYWSSWMGAISGKRGIIVSPPPKEIRDQFIKSKWQSKKQDREARHAARKGMKEKALEMRARGRTYREIGAELGVTVSVVSKLVLR